MSDDYLNGLIRKHRTNGILIDTNLLLMLLVGHCDPKMIPSFKRTQQFTSDNYDLLLQLLGYFDRIVTTPTILAEVNSLGNLLQSRHKARFLSIFKHQVLATLEERYEPSRGLCEHVYFPKCGLSDSAILAIGEQGLLVLTDDFALTGFLTARSVDWINFNHIRGMAY